MPVGDVVVDLKAWVSAGGWLILRRSSWEYLFVRLLRVVKEGSRVDSGNTVSRDPRTSRRC